MNKGKEKIEFTFVWSNRKTRLLLTFYSFRNILKNEERNLSY